MSSTYARTSALRAVPAAPIAGTRHRPLPIPSVRLVGGPLAAWQQHNGEATIPHCIEQFEVSEVLDNFRRVLGESGAEFRGPVFADSDLYKVIEAVAWEIARTFPASGRPGTCAPAARTASTAPIPPPNSATSTR